MPQPDCVVAVFDSSADARGTISLLKQGRLGDGNISLITRSNESAIEAEAPVTQGDQMEKSAAMGAGAGATIGLLASSALLVIPGIGPVAFAGALASGITGGLVGGIVGAMSGWGVRGDQLEAYELDVREGRTIVIVHGDPRQLAEAKTLLQESPARSVSLHAESADSRVDA